MNRGRFPLGAAPRTSSSRRRLHGARAGLATLLLGVVGGSGRQPGAPAPPARGLSAPVESGRDARDNALVSRARDEIAAAERAHGAQSKETAAALADLVHLLWGFEEYAAALPLAERALAIRKETLGDSLQVAASEYQVGELRRATGDYAGALRAHRSAVSIWEERLGPEATEIADSLHYMGVIHSITGDVAAARACLERALHIRQRRLGPMHDRVASTLQALGSLGLQSGDPGALALFERAQAIWEAANGPDHPTVARSLVGRASALAAAGRLAEARPLLERALAIRVAAFGAEHYLVARSRAEIAGLTAREGDAPSAEREYDEALRLERLSLGPSHPETASTLADLARLRWSAGEAAPALAAALEAEAAARDSFRRSSRDLDDDEALLYESVRTTGLDVALTAVASGGLPEADGRGAGDAAADGQGFGAVADALIRSRAMVLDERTRARRETSGDATRPDAAGEGAGFAAVHDALPADGALVAYALYARVGGPREPPVESYVAMIARPDRDRPIFVSLGAAADLDARVAEWRAAISADPRAAAGGEDRARAAGRRLRAAIWDPVEPAIAGAGRIYVVPDGAIDLVSFAALPAGADRYVVESGPLIHYLSAERDLVRRRRPAAVGTGALVLGGPDFEAAPAAGPAGATGARDDSMPGPRPDCREFSRLAFDPLPGAAAEAEEIAARHPAGEDALLLTGAAASAGAFVANAPGRRVLHLATHAYVLPEGCGTDSGAEDSRAAPSMPDRRRLLRSGLAFSGANRGPRSGPAADAPNDGDATATGGILTAEEIAGLDLSGVEWVVLSACDTGLGEVRAGEGVVGLRRAFQRAGAETVITSLWDVDDGAARAFMRALYAGRRSGLATAEAMRQASLRMIAAQRERGRSTHPYYWGGFVAAGE